MKTAAGRSGEGKGGCQRAKTSGSAVQRQGIETERLPTRVDTADEEAR